MHKSKKHFLKNKNKKWNSRKKCYRKKGGSVGDWWDLRTHMCPSASASGEVASQSQLYPEPPLNPEQNPEPQFYPPQNPEPQQVLPQQTYPSMGMDLDNAEGKLDTYGGELEKEFENKVGVGGRRRKRVHRTTEKKKRKHKKSKHSRKQRGKGNVIRAALGNSGWGYPEDDDYIPQDEKYLSRKTDSTVLADRMHPNYTPEQISYIEKKKALSPILKYDDDSEHVNFEDVNFEEFAKNADLERQQRVAAEAAAAAATITSPRVRSDEYAEYMRSSEGELDPSDASRRRELPIPRSLLPPSPPRAQGPPPSGFLRPQSSGFLGPQSSGFLRPRSSGFLGQPRAQRPPINTNFGITSNVSIQQREQARRELAEQQQREQARRELAEQLRLKNLQKRTPEKLTPDQSPSSYNPGSGHMSVSSIEEQSPSSYNPGSSPMSLSSIEEQSSSSHNPVTSYNASPTFREPPRKRKDNKPTPYK